MKEKFIVLVVVIFLSNIVYTQDTTELNEGQVTSKVVTNKTYNDVLDIVFPRNQVKEKTDWRIILRFKPNSSPESQIIIHKKLDGFEITEIKSIDGIIFAKLNQWVTKNNREDAEEMARILTVSERKIEISKTEIQSIYKDFFDSSSKTNKFLKSSGEEYDKKGYWSVILHGTFYEVWFYSTLRTLKFDIYDEEINDKEITGESPIVKWMNKIRLDIQKR